MVLVEVGEVVFGPLCIRRRSTLTSRYLTDVVPCRCRKSSPPPWIRRGRAFVFCWLPILTIGWGLHIRPMWWRRLSIIDWVRSRNMHTIVDELNCTLCRVMMWVLSSHYLFTVILFLIQYAWCSMTEPSPKENLIYATKLTTGVRKWIWIRLES